VLAAGPADDCVAEARRAKPDILVIDLGRPGPSGLDVLGELRGHPPLGEAAVIAVAA
jgi:CheY-like chemotaxis protein